jgi:ATP synthase I chain
MNLRRIYRLGFIILLCLAAGSAFFEWKKLPLSIFIGGLLGLANLKGLAWGLRDFAASRPTGRVIFWSMVRFFILGLILFILALLNLINFIGILIGFTVVFALILKEGLRTAREYSETSTGDEVKQSIDLTDPEK